MRRSSQTIAMSLRHYLYAVSPGATHDVYPNGPGTRPVPTRYTDAERADLAHKLGGILAEWRETDPEGFTAWEAAQAAGEADADPCAYCQSCRATRAQREREQRLNDAMRAAYAPGGRGIADAAALIFG